MGGRGDLTATAPGAGTDLAGVAARFAGLLHSAGLPVSPERAGRFAAAMALAPPALMPDLYWLARVTLLDDHSSIAVFEAVFASVFGGMTDPADFRGDAPPPPELPRGRIRPPAPGAPSRPDPTPSPAPGPTTAGEGPDGSVDAERIAAVLSPEERLRHRDFARLSPGELQELRSLAERLALVAPLRPSRRRRRHHHGRDLDLRATIRLARRTGGEPLVRVTRRRRRRPRRLVLLCDISGSMEAYARAYLQLLVSSVGAPRAEAFVFATRLTRLTPTLRGRSPDAALEQAGSRAPDWSGGTRIGGALKAFNDGYGRRGLARGAVVLILSDGWDTGDPAVVSREMERLSRLAHRIVWVNPRKAAPGYSPRVGGMAAALPHVDAFVSGHTLAALEEVLDAVAG